MVSQIKQELLQSYPSTCGLQDSSNLVLAEFLLEKYISALGGSLQTI